VCSVVPVLLLCVFSQAALPADPRAPSAIAKVADAVLRDFPTPPPFDWGEGVLMAGMVHAHRSTGDAGYLAFVRAWADAWCARDVDALLGKKGYCGHWGPAFPLLLLYETTKEPRYLELARKVVAYMTKDAGRTTEDGFNHFSTPPQLWVDTLYMACPVLAAYSRVTGEPAHQAEGVRQARIFARALEDPQKHLYYHMYDEKTGLRSRELWARGNGWVAMTLVELLRAEGKDTQARRELGAALARLLCAVAALQDEATGLWHTVLDARETYVETSAAAMFLFALTEARALGVETGVPDAVAARAWEGLLSKLDDQGRVTGVSTGTVPSTREAYARIPCRVETWGTGAFLLAACAYAKSVPAAAATK
jgi:unsaturated rhamnogalacturonyl hydrolase